MGYSTVLFIKLDIRPACCDHLVLVVAVFCTFLWLITKCVIVKCSISLLCMHSVTIIMYIIIIIIIIKALNTFSGKC